VYLNPLAMDALEQIEDMKRKRTHWMQQRENEKNMNNMGISDQIFNDDKGKVELQENDYVVDFTLHE